MNKARRQELKQLRYKKRLLVLGLLSTDTLLNPKGTQNNVCYNFTGYKNSSNPCSCYLCSNRKYNRAKSKNALLKDLILTD